MFVQIFPSRSSGWVYERSLLSINRKRRHTVKVVGRDEVALQLGVDTNGEILHFERSFKYLRSYFSEDGSSHSIEGVMQCIRMLSERVMIHTVKCCAETESVRKKEWNKFIVL